MHPVSDPPHPQAREAITLAGLGIAITRLAGPKIAPTRVERV